MRKVLLISIHLLCFSLTSCFFSGCSSKPTVETHSHTETSAPGTFPQKDDQDSEFENHPFVPRVSPYQADPAALRHLDARYIEYLSYVDRLALEHQDVFTILKDHLARAMSAYAEAWKEKDLENIAKMQLANVVATSDRQKDLVASFGQSINFKDVFVPAEPFADDEDGVNIALIDEAFNAVPLLEMDKLIAYYTYNSQSEHIELVDADFPLPEYAYHMGRQFKDVGGMDFNLGSKVRKPINTSDLSSQRWENWEPVESPLTQNLSKNVNSLTLKKNNKKFLTVTTNPYSQLANNQHFISVLNSNGVFAVDPFDKLIKRKLVFDRDYNCNASGATFSRTLLQHAPKTKIVLIDLKFINHIDYHDKVAAEIAYRKIQREIEGILIQHKVHFTIRANWFNTKFDGKFDRCLDGDRFADSKSSHTFLEIFAGGHISFDRDELFHRNLQLVKGNFSNSLVVNSFSSGCAELPAGLKFGLTKDAFRLWAEKSPDINIFSFSPTFSFPEFIASNDVFINRHVCFNWFNAKSFPDLNDYYGELFDDGFSDFDPFDPQCFMHRHQGCCRKRSFESRAKDWQYFGEKSNYPDFEWTDYFGFVGIRSDRDETNRHIYEIRAHQLDGDSSKIVPIVAAWASYIKRTSFAGEARSPELFRKIKDRMTGSGIRPFQDPLAFDELPVFLDGRSGKLASYRFKPGLLLPH